MIRYSISGYEPRYAQVTSNGAVVEQDENGEWCKFEDVVERRYYRLPDNYEEARKIVEEHRARVVPSELFEGFYVLTWEPGFISLRKGLEESTMQAAAFILMWLNGMDTGNAATLSYFHGDHHSVDL